MPDTITLTAPILIPQITALLTLLLRGHRRAQRAASLAGFATLLVAAGWLLAEVSARGVIATQIGGWPAPFGITFVADRLAALMVGVASMMGLAVGVYSLADLEPGRERHGHHPLLHLLLMGVCGSFLTGDLFNLYVWFEVMLIASFVLMTLGGFHEQLEGALKYVTLNLLGSMIFLAAVGLLYSQAGTLNMADLHQVVGESGGDGLLLTIAVMLLVAFGIKAALFPLFMWLPSSYHTPPTAVSALFAGLLTKVGVYALLRVFTLIFTFEIGWTHTLLMGVLAALTMAVGIFGAVVQGTIRRILTFNLVSHIGYMVMGLALFTLTGIAGAVFYMIHHIIVKTSLFLISGVVTRVTGRVTLRHLGGLVRSHPALAALFMLPALSLAGMPPLSGFWGKLLLIQAAVEAQAWWLAAVALGVGLLTLYSMIKIWGDAFWKPAPEKDADEIPVDESLFPSSLPAATAWLMYAPVVLLVAATVAIGLYPVWLLEHAQQAAAQLMDPTPYVRAVLGEGAP